MAKIGTVTFSGKSGIKFIFDYWDFPGTWDSVAGVYIVAVYNVGSDSITPLYVGETDDLKERFIGHHKQRCFDKYKANILCWWEERDFASRRTIELDLINGLKPICNAA